MQNPVSSVSEMPLPLKLPTGKLESREAATFIGWYSFILHFWAGFYFLGIYRGSSSDWVPSPLFEYSDNTLTLLALILATYSFLFTLIGSLSLIRGVRTETRIYYFPWLILSLIEIVLLCYHVFCLVWRYSYDGFTMLMALVILLFTIKLLYCYLIVLSNYRHLKKIQSPTLIFPPEL